MSPFRQSDLLRENGELKDLCLYLDEERSHDVTCPAPGCGRRFQNPALINTALTNTLGSSGANHGDGGGIGGNSNARAPRYVEKRKGISVLRSVGTEALKHLQ